METIPTVYLTRRNLQTLLNKLDRVKNGESSACTLIKNDDKHPVYPQSHPSIRVIALENEEYYTDRDPGDVNPIDDPGI